MAAAAGVLGASASTNAPLAAPKPALAWPQWRGPLATGVSPTAQPPVEWSETRNVRWKLPLPGKGHSSPILLGERVIVMTAAPVGEAQKPVFDQAPGVHDSVPVTHRHEYAVQSVSRKDGRLAWKTVVREEWHDLGRMNTLHAHGEGSSPVVHGGLLVVNWDHEGGSFIQAFDARTGDSRWKTARDEKTSWSTPIVVEVDGKPQVIVSATRRVRGYDLATGALIWECAGLTDNVVASPVVHRGVLIAGNSYYVQAMLALRLSGARGDVSDSDRVVWRMNRLTPYVASPLLYDDTLYHLRHNQNVLVRLDPATGKLRGELLRLEGIRDFIFASPVGA
ncbi:MAG: PQQ-like beta-propeller repeat protein, partial [Verrucomicrobium sp.]|nr:PQQ-like beta-propeller repeat protein [Verrucomicrobium sp.]